MQLQLMGMQQLITPTLHCKVSTDAFTQIGVSGLDPCVRFPIACALKAGWKSDIPQLSTRILRHKQLLCSSISVTI